MSVDKKFKVGDTVCVNHSDYSEEVPVGTMTTVSDIRGHGLLIRGKDTTDWFFDFDEVELVPDAQTIEVGDTVKATHTDGSTVQGVVDDVSVGKYVSFGLIDMGFWFSNGWTFEVVSKAVKPPRVGDAWREGLDVPVGTVIEFQDKSGTLYLSRRGWTLHTGTHPVAERHIGPATIVYLPESAND